MTPNDLHLELNHALPFLLATLWTLICVATVRGAVADFDSGNTSFLDLQDSIAEFQRCSFDGRLGCFKAFLDPEPVTSGTFSIVVEPAERFGPISEITYFNGYGPAEPISTEIVGDAAIISLPVLQESPPPEPFDGMIASVEFVDLGSESFEQPAAESLRITFDAQEVMAIPPGGTEPEQVEQVETGEIEFFSAELDTDQVVPSPDLGQAQSGLIAAASPGEPQGAAVVAFNLDTGRVDVTGSFQNLSSDFLNAGLYGPADFGETAPLLVDANNHEVADKMSQPRTSGDFQFSGQLTAEQGGWLLNRQTYVQVNTVGNPNTLQMPAGEIRGQVVPEPSALGLLIVALISIGAFRGRTGT